MSEKRPQSTDVLIRRLRRIAKWLDLLAASTPSIGTEINVGLVSRAGLRARSNTCWQAAGRLDKLGGEIAETVSE